MMRKSPFENSIEAAFVTLINRPTWQAYLESTEKREEKLQTSVPCLCYCFLVEYLALAGLMNFLAQLSDKIHHFTVYNLMPLAFLTKLSKMH